MKQRLSDCKEQISESLVQGLNLGIILFTSSLVSLKFIGLTEGLTFLLSHLFVILFCYMVTGILIRLSRLISIGNDKLFYGMAVLNWLLFALIVLILIRIKVPVYIQTMLYTNLLVLFLLWLAQYRYVTAVSRELNRGGYRPRRWIINLDLETPPKTIEEFYDFLENYCIKNHMSLEYDREKTELPATVKLDGKVCKVKISRYYAYGGVIYTLDITEI